MACFQPRGKSTFVCLRTAQWYPPLPRIFAIPRCCHNNKEVAGLKQTRKPLGKLAHCRGMGTTRTEQSCQRSLTCVNFSQASLLSQHNLSVFVLVRVAQEKKSPGKLTDNRSISGDDDGCPVVTMESDCYSNDDEMRALLFCTVMATRNPKEETRPLELPYHHALRMCV